MKNKTKMDDGSLEFTQKQPTEFRFHESVESEDTANVTGNLFDDLIQSFAIESLELMESADEILMNLEKRPTDVDSLNGLFRIFHTIKGNAGFLSINPCVVKLAHEAENLLEGCREGKFILRGDAFLLILECTKTLQEIIEHLGAQLPVSSSLVDDVARYVHKLKAYHCDELREEKQHLELGSSEIVATEFQGFEDKAEADSVGGGNEGGAKPFEKKAVANETIRVDRARLDQLVALVGELVIAQSMAQQELVMTPGDRQTGYSKSRGLGQLNRITRSLQELSLSLRMVPLRSTFQKMNRVARDLTRKLGKEVDIHLFGEQTELDKTVVDEIGDPLMHMVRNAIDHGVESDPEERTRLGKPRIANVSLRAFHQSGCIHIEIEDDGRGLNPEKLVAKARSLGLVAEDQTLSEQEAFHLIFEPGFSTAEKVTDVSGRGVGMDVVKRNIQSLRGSIDIRSKLNHGSCFTIKLPLTLAIIDGMVVRAGRSRFVIPILSVTELMRFAGARISTVTGKSEILSVRDTTVPIIQLNKLFKTCAYAVSDENAIIVVVQDGEKTAALRVDEVLGQQQVVIKQLGLKTEQCQAVAGGAIMPDGQIGIILDIHGVIHAFENASFSSFDIDRDVFTNMETL